MKTQGWGWVLMWAWGAMAQAQVHPDFVTVAANDGAAVVQLLVEQQSTAPAASFFGRLLGYSTAAGPTREVLASGFVVNQQGHVVTHAAVLKEARRVVAQFRDQRRFMATVVGRDEVRDVGLLRLERVVDSTGAGRLPTVRGGQAQPLRVGQWVAAMGAPFGFEQTITQGIISLLQLPTNDERHAIMQLDVAVNPGSEGGPLFNSDGRVVGMIVALEDAEDENAMGYTGFSFAVPWSAIQAVLTSFGIATD